MMIFRKARPEERELLFRDGYQVWHKNRTFEEYCADNEKDDAHGTRYVLEDGGKIVSSNVILELKPVCGHRAYGIGSVLTFPGHRHSGYATALLENGLRQIDSKNSYVFLHSEVPPAFYGRFGFRRLPADAQKYSASVLMVLCGGILWEELLASPREGLPGHF